MAETGVVMNEGYSAKIDGFLRERLSAKYYEFWKQFTSQFPLPFHKLSSSSGKYHRSTAGTVVSLEKHTMDLMQFVDKLARIFGDSKEEQHYDLLLLSAALHDIMKYGKQNSRKHTTKDHDALVAARIKEKGAEFGLTDYETETLHGLVLYHSGRWNSTNPGFKPIAFTQLQLFLHIADMCSAARILTFE